MTEPSANENSVRSDGLRAERVGPGAYMARNERGGEVLIGLPGMQGSFTPGELLHLAAASCAAVSADHTFASRLGQDFPATLIVEALENAADERYTRIDTRLSVDMSSIDTDRHAALVERAQRAIDRLCTVGRTLSHGATANVEVEAASLA